MVECGCGLWLARTDLLLDSYRLPDVDTKQLKQDFKQTPVPQIPSTNSSSFLQTPDNEAAAEETAAEEKAEEEAPVAEEEVKKAGRSNFWTFTPSQSYYYHILALLVSDLDLMISLQNPRL